MVCACAARIVHLSAVAGILIFPSATAALHGDEQRAEHQKSRIGRAAWVHIGCLGLGVLLRGGRLVEKVLTEVPAPPSVANSHQ